MLVVLHRQKIYLADSLPASFLFCPSGGFVSEVLAYLFIGFFIVIPLLIKMKVCLAKYENPMECDCEAGIERSISQQTLRVPENGGVE